MLVKSSRDASSFQAMAILIILLHRKKTPCSMRKRECKKLEALSLEKSNATGSSITKLSRSITLSIDDNFCS
jgi:hypothetical protein